LGVARVHINRKFLAVCRTIHIYLTMLGLSVMLLFGITGFTINHEAWFGATEANVSEIQGTTPTALIEKQDRLGVVEHLRSAFRIDGAVSGYDDLDDTLSIGFKTPKEIWEVEIDKATGKTTIHLESFNFTALINNLHRGRYAGASWAWVIDVSAILIVIACFTGVVLWLVLPKRRQIGTAAMLLGTIGVIGIYFWLVPGADPDYSAPPQHLADGGR
jgi:hypothetical protein